MTTPRSEAFLLRGNNKFLDSIESPQFYIQNFLDEISNPNVLLLAGTVLAYDMFQDDPQLEEYNGSRLLYGVSQAAAILLVAGIFRAVALQHSLHEKPHVSTDQTLLVFRILFTVMMVWLWQKKLKSSQSRKFSVTMLETIVLFSIIFLAAHTLSE